MGRLKKYKTEEERKAANREAAKRWREQHPEQNRESSMRYYYKNLEKERERARRYREDNHEKVKECQKRFRHDNPEKVKERQRQYRQNNPEKVRESERRWRENNPDKVKETRKQYNKTPMGRANRLVDNYQQADKKYNRGECTLTAKWIVDNIFNKPCHYNCGESDWKKIGCDRIDNSLPHTPDNVVPCCDECNKKRGRKTYEEFLMSLKNEQPN